MRRQPSHRGPECYVGLNGGYGWNNGRISYNDPNVIGGSGWADADPINHVPDINGFTDAYIPTPTSVNGLGGLAGLEGGCNWQIQQWWVLGVEADLDWTNIGRTNTTSANSGPLAYKSGITTRRSVTVLTPGSPSLTWSGANSTVKIGGVMGAGLEWAFYDRWTVKAEYLWYDLGSSSHPLNCSIVISSGCATFSHA